MDLKHNRNRFYRGNLVFRGDPVEGYTKEQADRMVESGQAYWEPVANVEENEPENYPHHIGGGWYKLSDGTTVKGREEAETEEAEL